jgi:hypothetical protein
MNQTTYSIAEQGFARVAGNHYSNTLSHAFGDARLGLKFMLLRLSLLGITVQDREQLRDLARLAFYDKDVTKAADRIKKRRTASPLAVAIADVVASAEEKKLAMLGAVFGAYVTGGILGAITGAVALSTSQFVAQQVEVNRFLEAE